MPAKDDTVTARLDVNIRTELEAIHNTEGWSVSHIIRIAVTRYIKSYKEEKAKKAAEAAQPRNGDR